MNKKLKIAIALVLILQLLASFSLLIYKKVEFTKNQVHSVYHLTKVQKFYSITKISSVHMLLT